MTSRSRTARLAWVVALVLLCAVISSAEPIWFQGTFNQDDDLASIGITLASDGTLTVRTLSFAGGTASDGTVVPAGGFAPVLALFDSTGLEIGAPDYWATCDANHTTADPTSGFCYDAFLSFSLPAGGYLLAVSQADNVPSIGLWGAGYTRDGQPEFTGQTWGPGSGTFYLQLPDSYEQRTGNWFVDINADVDFQAGEVPEPNAMMLLIAGVLSLCSRRLRRV
jgi:hypothetical protein